MELFKKVSFFFFFLEMFSAVVEIKKKTVFLLQWFML